MKKIGSIVFQLVVVFVMAVLIMLPFQGLNLFSALLVATPIMYIGKYILALEEKWSCE